MTTKKMYEKPSMKVHVLNSKPQLLAGSAGLNDYQWNTPDEE